MKSFLIFRIKTFLILGLILSAFTGSGGPARSQVRVVEGKVAILSADPSDVVITLDKNGPCGTAYFHVQRTNQNFSEMTALAMTAFAGGKTMALFVTSCATDRNIISHGYAGRD